MPKGIYLCGNSLGPQPKRLGELLKEELHVWQDRAVKGHFDHPFKRDWVTIDDLVVDAMGRVVGAFRDEIAVMNSLTVNLHLLMMSFYKPTAARYKILMEAKAFPSDYFCIASQAEMRGYDPSDTVIQLSPEDGYCLSTEQILKTLDEHGDSIALVLFSGVQYYTGQYFDIPQITAYAHNKGCIVGWDLAHAVGNVELHLHDWNVDFAAWCTYKYLNSGPGNIGGAFVHKKHHSMSLKRLAGWWGQNPETKFEMSNEFEPIPGANGFRMSNPSVLAVISLYASLEIFEQTSMKQLSAMSKKLTGYLEKLIDERVDPQRVQVITPRDPKQRGCQLSLLFLKDDMMAVHGYLDKHGITCDERKPNVIRVAPAPLYNTKEDVDAFVRVLVEALDQTRAKPTTKSSVKANENATANVNVNANANGKTTKPQARKTAEQPETSKTLESPKSPKKPRNESTV